VTRPVDTPHAVGHALSHAFVPMAVLALILADREANRLVAHGRVALSIADGRLLAAPPETLAGLVQAAEACHDLSLAWKTPFISGKDSLYNEFLHDGQSRSIPPTLLISALGQLEDVHTAVTMDLKTPGNELWILGETQAAMGGSVWSVHFLNKPAEVPVVHPELALRIFQGLHEAIRRGLVRSCHDVSEGGLAVALAEMALGGRLGARVSLRDIPAEAEAALDPILLFGESPSRFVVEVEPRHAAELAELWGELPMGKLGEVVGADAAGGCGLTVTGLDKTVIVDASVREIEAAWKRPLDWSLSS